jgi:hypothetical protein
MAPPELLPPHLGPEPRSFEMYWLRGDAPGYPAAVSDPPCSGSQHALLMVGRTPKTARVLDVLWVRAWTLPADCVELRAGREASPGSTARLLDRLSAGPYLGLDGSADAAAAAEFLRAAGRASDAEKWEKWASERRAESVTGTAAPGGLPGLKAGTRRAEVLEFFMAAGGTAPLAEAEAALGMNRNGVLSHLWALKKYHGADYSLDKGTATVTVPNE